MTARVRTGRRPGTRRKRRPVAPSRRPERRPSERTRPVPRAAPPQRRRPTGRRPRRPSPPRLRAATRVHGRRALARRTAAAPRRSIGSPLPARALWVERTSLQPLRSTDAPPQTEVGRSRDPPKTGDRQTRPADGTFRQETGVDQSGENGSAPGSGRGRSSRASCIAGGVCLGGSPSRPILRFRRIPKFQGRGGVRSAPVRDPSRCCARCCNCEHEDEPLDPSMA